MLTNPDNSKVKYFSLIKNKKKRKTEGRFLVEGVHLVEEALLKGLLDRAIYSKSILRTAEGSALLGRMISAGIPVEEASDKIIDHLSSVETPQGVIASFRPKVSDLGVLFESADPLIIVACGIQDPGNLGTMIRTASAAGSSGMILTQGTVDPFNEKVIRASAGSIFHLNMIKIDDIIELVPSLKRRGVKVISSFATATKAYYDVDYKGPSAILVGNEGQGLPEVLERMSDEAVSIPMCGATESLNAAVSAAVILYEAMRQRRTVGGIISKDRTGGDKRH